MISYSESQVEKLLSEKPFWGYMKDYIRENDSIQQLTFRMLKREKKSWHTLRRYFEGIKKFCQYIGAETPDGALAKVKNSKEPAEVVDDYINYLVDQDLTPINIKAHFFGVKKWLIANRVRIHWEFVAKPKVGTRIRDRIPTKEELRRTLNNANLRDKALFMTALSSGLRAGTLVKLQVKDFRAIKDLGIIQVEGGEGKKLSKDKWYFTFVTPETRQVIEDYLATREAKPDSPLFSTLGKEAFFDKYITNVSRQWRKLIQKAKLGSKIENHNWTQLHLHVLRKFFQTTCKLSGIKADYYDFWLGHVSTKKEQYLNDSYFRATVEQHLEQYRKAISGLTVFGRDSEDIEAIVKERVTEEMKALYEDYKQNLITLAQSPEIQEKQQEFLQLYAAQELKKLLKQIPEIKEILKKKGIL